MKIMLATVTPNQGAERELYNKTPPLPFPVFLLIAVVVVAIVARMTIETCSDVFEASMAPSKGQIPMRVVLGVDGCVRRVER
jgi:hypothetical protein